MKNISQKRRSFVLTLGKAMGVAGVVSAAPQAFAKGRGHASIQSVSLKKGDGGQQRLVFKLDKSIKHKVMTLSSPDRIVIDFIDTKPKAALKLSRNSSTLIKKLRQSSRNKNDFRVVLDMAGKTKATTKLKPSGNGYQLEVAFNPFGQQSAGKSAVGKPKAVTPVSRNKGKTIIVAIDAGHGGNDPGAVGKKGTKEKSVVLQISKRLKKHIDRQPGMKGVLIRDGDYYVSLRKRIAKARKNKADLFISIHADANPSRKLTGSSVYILSKGGASSEQARWLANSENSYEMKMAGAHLRKQNKVVSSLLLELSLSDTIDKSLNLAGGVLKELGSVNRLLRRRVESAGFVVLKSPDIPSMLVETAFISNAMEEKRLKTSAYQEKLAKAIFKGVRQYQVASIEMEQKEYLS
ncbi:MAG: N-acetylmuramoyl-L-alanine amidase [Cocleimonas sp.]|nr:N-acetylmuramoyl-L-alanine amidase [Cocleimonas sp.]